MGGGRERVPDEGRFAKLGAIASLVQAALVLAPMAVAFASLVGAFPTNVRLFTAGTMLGFAIGVGG